MSKASYKYISNMFDQGITDRNEIINQAKTRISEIDKVLHEADALRVEKMKLREVLADLGDNNSKPASKNNLPRLELDDHSEEAIQLRTAICSAIEQNGPMTNREINQKVGQYQNEAKVIYALKYLAVNGIVQRDGSPDNKVVPGPKWDDRAPYLDSN